MSDLSPNNISIKSILFGFVCIVGANLLLVALRTVYNPPLSDGLESGIATGLGVVAWFFIGGKIKA